MDSGGVTLHIGWHKTGTTSLQRWLSANRSLLASHGVFYPLSGWNGRDAHHPLAEMIEQGDENHAAIESMALSLCSEIDQGEDWRRIVFSSERMRLWAEPEIKCLQAFLDHVRLELDHVVCYLLPQERFIEASYCQRVKLGREHNLFPALADGYVGTDNPNLHYDAILGRWSSLRPSPSVTPRPYNSRMLEEGGTVADFLRNVLGIARSGGLTVGNNEQNNRTPDIRALAVALRLAGDYPDQVAEVPPWIFKVRVTMRLDDELGRLGLERMRPYLFTPIQRRQLRSLYQASNRRLAEIHDLDQEFFDPVDETESNAYLLDPGRLPGTLSDHLMRTGIECLRACAGEER